MFHMCPLQQHKAQEHKEDRRETWTLDMRTTTFLKGIPMMSSFISQHLLTHKSLGVAGKVGVSADRESQSP